MDEQGRYVDLREVAAEVGQPGVDAGVGRVGRRADGDDEAVLPGLVRDAGAGVLVDVVEVVEEVLEVGVAVLTIAALMRSRSPLSLG